MNIPVISQKLEGGHAPGWQDVQPHDPQVQDAANHAVKSLQQKSNSLFPYELQEIVHAKAENASPEKSKDRKDAETAEAGPSSSKDASCKKSTCGNDAETSGAGLSSKEAADSKSKEHIQDLKEELKRMIMAPAKRPSQKLHFIDHIQRLGVSYHFEDEIDQILQQVHREEEYDDLCTTALSFRLLRQQGYNTSCNMFNKFKDDDGRFKELLIDDVLGLLSLYEASHLQMLGEDILNEALTFTTAHLESAAHHLSSSSLLWKQVTHALYQPLWQGMPRIEARHYLCIYQEDDSHNETLLNFAKLDFNTVLKVHQKELSEITRLI